MSLTLIARHPANPAAAYRADFHEPGGTLGRAAENDLALPEPDGRLCRVQAVLRIDAGAGRLHNLSTMGEVRVNDVPLPAGQQAAVAPGDVLRLGGHVVDVMERGQAETAAPSGHQAPSAAQDAGAAQAPAAMPAEDVFSGLFGPGTLPVGSTPDVSTHPFELESAQSRNPVDPLAHLAPDRGTPAAPRDPLALFDTPHGGPDVFADSTPSTLPAHDPLAPLRADPVRDTLHPAREARPAGPAARDHAAMPSAFLRPAAARRDDPDKR